MAKKSSTAKITDCLCTWVISPISVEYPQEELEEFHTEAERARKLSLPSRHRTHYTRDIKHDIHPECKVHRGLLEMSALPDHAHEVSAMRLLNERDMVTKEDAEEMVKAFTNRYPELVDWMHHLWDNSRKAVLSGRKVGKTQAARLGDRYRDRLAEGAELGVERVPKPDSCVCGSTNKGWRQTGPDGEICTDAWHDTVTEKQYPPGYEMLVDHGGKIGVQRVEVPPVLNIREVVDEANRRTYEERKNSNFFTPVDDPEGEGHCRECHHECRFEHEGKTGAEVGCMAPTCGHFMGCPSC